MCALYFYSFYYSTYLSVIVSRNSKNMGIKGVRLFAVELFLSVLGWIAICFVVPFSFFLFCFVSFFFLLLQLSMMVWEFCLKKLQKTLFEVFLFLTLLINFIQHQERGISWVQTLIIKPRRDSVNGIHIKFRNCRGSPDRSVRTRSWLCIYKVEKERIQLSQL